MWEVVWDSRNIAEVYDHVLLTPVPFAVIGIISLYLRKWIFSGLFLLLSIIPTVYLVYEYYDLRKSIDSGQFNSIEGIVSNFEPGEEVNDPNRTGSHHESFTVNDVSFSYHHRNFQFCFRQTVRVGGPIKEGLRVRIQYIDNCIIRLEIEK